MDLVELAVVVGGEPEQQVLHVQPVLPVQVYVCTYIHLAQPDTAFILLHVQVSLHMSYSYVSSCRAQRPFYVSNWPYSLVNLCP